MEESQEIPIDKAGLLRYKKRQELVSLCVTFGAVVAAISAAVALPGESPSERYTDTASLYKAVLRNAGIGFVIGFALGYCFHYLFVRRLATRFTEAYHVSVEGPYLRIITFGLSYLDQKIHFRNLDNYAVYQDASMRRAGIKCIRIEHIARSQTATRRTITILAPVAAEESRDALAALDSQREDDAN